MSRQDDTAGSTDRPDQARGRSSAEIEKDIAGIRSRMDRTLDEIEYRLSPGQVTATVRDTLRDVVEGNPDNRIAMAIRHNPLPVALIGIGVLWLGISVLRETSRPTGGRAMGTGGVAATLAPLVQIARDGAEALRAAEGATDDAAFRGVLADYAYAQERSAAALESELRRHDPSAAVPAGMTGGHPAWSELRRAAASHDRNALIRGAERGLGGMLDALRDALHENLPEQTRVVVGSQYHAAEQMHNRLDALRQAA